MPTTSEDRLIIAANDVLAEAKELELTSTLMQVRIGLGENPEPGEYLDLERTGTGDYQVCGHTPLWGERMKPCTYRDAVQFAVDHLQRRIAKKKLIESIERVVDVVQEDLADPAIFDQDGALEVGD